MNTNRYARRRLREGEGRSLTPIFGSFRHGPVWKRKDRREDVERSDLKLRPWRGRLVADPLRRPAFILTFDGYDAPYVVALR